MKKYIETCPRWRAKVQKMHKSMIMILFVEILKERKMSINDLHDFFGLSKQNIPNYVREIELVYADHCVVTTHKKQNYYTLVEDAVPFIMRHSDIIHEQDEQE